MVALTSARAIGAVTATATTAPTSAARRRTRLRCIQCSPDIVVFEPAADGRDASVRRQRCSKLESNAAGCAASASTLLSSRLQGPRPRLASMHRHLQTRAVLLADECLLREGLRRVLEAGGVVVVAHSTTAEELVRKVSAHRPDVVVVAQGASGAVLGAAVAFRRRLPAAALLVLGVDVRRTIA